MQLYGKTLPYLEHNVSLITHSHLVYLFSSIPLSIHLSFLINTPSQFTHSNGRLQETVYRIGWVVEETVIPGGIINQGIIIAVLVWVVTLSLSPLIVQQTAMEYPQLLATLAISLEWINCATNPINPNHNYSINYTITRTISNSNLMDDFLASHYSNLSLT